MKQLHLAHDEHEFNYCDATGKKQAVRCELSNHTVVDTFQSCRVVVEEARRHFVVFESGCLAGAVLFTIAVKMRNSTVRLILFFYDFLIPSTFFLFPLAAAL